MDSEIPLAASSTTHGEEELTEEQVADRLIGVSTQRHLPEYGLLLGRIAGFDACRRRFNVIYEDGSSAAVDGLSRIAETLPREHARFVRAWLSARQGPVSKPLSGRSFCRCRQVLSVLVPTLSV